MKKEDYPIDFVITWVDGSDPKWLAEYAKWKENEGDKRAFRFRSMDNLEYWFRTVEKFAPWVNKIYFVTCGQKPEWLNIDNPKLVCVNHEDFIPKEYLPTFSSRAIEWNLHRIPGLSEHFVYFNDDLFLTKPVDRRDFFIDGMPCDSAIMTFYPLLKKPPFLVNYSNISVINRNFNKREVVRNAFWKFFSLKNRRYLIRNVQFAFDKYFPAFKQTHVPISCLKQAFYDVWEAEPELIDLTCKHKFRVMSDLNIWLMMNWQICTNRFAARDVDFGYYLSIDTDKELDRVEELILNSKYKTVCINDGDYLDFSKFKIEVNRVLKKLVPEISSFEIGAKLEDC